MHEPLLTAAFAVEGAADVAALSFRRRPPRLSRMDRLSALALAAVDGALASRAGAIEEGEGLAVVVGTRFGCHATNEAFHRGVLEGDPRAASPRLFAYTLPSSPLGEVSIHVGARGAAETIVSGRCAALEAIARAASLVASERARAVIVVAVEVGGGLLPALGHLVRDGAVAFLVERAGDGRGAAVRGAATAFDGGSRAAARGEAVKRAVAQAALGTDARVRSIEVADADAGVVASARALAAFVAAAAPGDPGLIAVDDASGGAAALVVGPPA